MQAYLTKQDFRGQGLAWQIEVNDLAWLEPKSGLLCTPTYNTLMMLMQFDNDVCLKFFGLSFSTCLIL